MTHSFSALRLAAETLFPVRGSWAYDSWAQINTRFFDDQLIPGSILWGLTAGCSYGSFNPNTNGITLHEALPGRDFAKQAKAQGEFDWVMTNRNQSLKSWGLSPASFGIGTALGTLLHEVMHQCHYQHDLQYGDDDNHHNPIWLAECQRVAVMIGLPERIWPLYIKRKETTEEVRTRLIRQGKNTDKKGKQLNNCRQTILVPTIDGQEIEVERETDVKGPTSQGQLLASSSEISHFPGESYERHEIGVAARVAMILPSSVGH